MWRIRHVDRAAGDSCGVEIFFEHVAEVGVCEAPGGFDARGAAGAVTFVEANDQGVADLGPGFTIDQCLRLIFRPGFSTAAEVSELSGRGVGLEIVDRAMEQTAGSVRVASEAGVGTTFSMIVPAALALVYCLVVRSTRQLYCIESARISDRSLLSAAQLEEINGRSVFDWQGEQLPVKHLRELLAQPAAMDSEQQRGLVVWQGPDRRGASPQPAMRQL